MGYRECTWYYKKAEWGCLGSMVYFCVRYYNTEIVNYRTGLLIKGTRVTDMRRVMSVACYASPSPLLAE
jgi:hypothetical protein